MLKRLTSDIANEIKLIYLVLWSGGVALWLCGVWKPSQFAVPSFMVCWNCHRERIALLGGYARRVLLWRL